MIQTFLHFIRAFRYEGIGILMFLESIILPLPGELFMAFGGFLSGRGTMTFLGIVLAGTAGELLGALPWYYAGLRYGAGGLDDWVKKHGRWLLLSPEKLRRTYNHFEKRGNITVIIGRLTPGIHSMIGLPAGVGKMPLLPFLFYTLVGTLIWVVAFTWAGLLLGRHYRVVSKYLGPIGIVVLVIATIGVVIWWRRQSRRRRR
jgi:membrane protein DedA with SNARE-associated domain